MVARVSGTWVNINALSVLALEKKTWKAIDTDMIYQVDEKLVGSHAKRGRSGHSPYGY